MVRHDLHVSRCDATDRLAADRLDVLVIGGGIVGAGIARDAAMRGLRTGLVEQHDLAFGTSSRSSRLLHGGLRYLAQGRLGLVREASHEKMVLHRIAPHVAEPLPFLFPTYCGTPWPLWKLRIGVKVYDLLCGGRNLGPSRAVKRARLLEELPGINPRNLTGAVGYYDGLTNDARLVLDTLRSAALSGAIVLNYTRLEDARRDSSGWTCGLFDILAGRRYEAAARCLVNATGPWAQSLPHSSIRLRLTKGVHLVVDRAKLSVPSAVVMAEGRRILFAIPWGDRVVLGTTDTDYEGSLDEVRAEPADMTYVLSVTNSAFPTAGLTKSDVISTWAGLRPLIASRRRRADAQSARGGPSDISRAHQIRMPEPGWLDVAGGKLTSYRHIAEEAVDRIVSHLRVPSKPCRTAAEPLLAPAQWRGFSGVLPPPVGREAVEHYCADEWAVHLADIMIRRTSWHYYHANASEIAVEVAGWMAASLGWDSSQRDAELTRYRQLG